MDWKLRLLVVGFWLCTMPLVALCPIIASILEQLLGRRQGTMILKIKSFKQDVFERFEYSWGHTPFVAVNMCTLEWSDTKIRVGKMGPLVAVADDSVPGYNDIYLKWRIWSRFYIRLEYLLISTSRLCLSRVLGENSSYTLRQHVQMFCFQRILWWACVCWMRIVLRAKCDHFRW